MSLSESDELEYLAILEAQYGGEGLDDFIRRVMPTLPPPTHTAPLRRLVEMTRHREVRAVVSMPPRHDKTLTLQPGLAWRTLRDPACVNAYVTYGDDFARLGSKRVRKLALFGGVTLMDDNAGAGDWRTPYGGGLIATGAQGQLTGKGITGLLVFDDPHKSRVEAESLLSRSRVWDAFGDAYTRLEPGASAIICHTRWHEDDTIGRLRSGQFGDRWEVIEMPAVMGPDGKAADERLDSEVHALWPDIYPLDWLAKRRQTLGEYRWASEYQQQPRPKGNTVFTEPARFDLAAFKADGCRFVIGVDPAATDKTHADFSVCVTLGVRGYGEEAIYYVLDVARWQVTVPELVSRIRGIQEHSRFGKGAPIVVEAVAGFKSVPQMLLSIDPQLRIKEGETKGSKFTRSQPLAAAWISGRILVPQQAPWLADYLAEMLSFTGTGDAHDDQVDATVHAFQFLSEGASKLAEALALASW